MRYGHSHGGIIRITLKPTTLKRWALSLHLCTQLLKYVMSLCDSDVPTAVTTHKVEGKARIQLDGSDGEKIQNKLATCIDPLKPENHPQDHLINIITGRIAPTTVNIDSAVSIREQLMKQYEAGWCESFHKPISKAFVTMSVSKERVNINSDCF